MDRSALPILVVILEFALIGCQGQERPIKTQTAAPAGAVGRQQKGVASMSFALTTTAFPAGGEIPSRYTCGGANLSPALTWSGVPEGAQALALIADDPDAPMGAWTHWLIWNIPAQVTELPEGVPATEVLEDGARQGKNDFGRIGYGGPCPPPGRPHRYFFKLYALDRKLDVKRGATRRELEAAVASHALSKTELMGTYRR
jgi:Raf kinase inhibitor-like YbhB/YbcL family protein